MSRVQFRDRPARRESPVVRLVRKLLALARDKAATPAEAAQAAERAADLIARHRLERDKLNPDGPVGDLQHGEFAFVPQDDAQIQWHAALLSLVCEANQCYCMLSLRNRTVEVVGLEDDAEVVAYMYEYLSREIYRLGQESHSRDSHLELMAFLDPWANRPTDWIAQFCMSAVVALSPRLLPKKSEEQTPGIVHRRAEAAKAELDRLHPDSQTIDLDTRPKNMLAAIAGLVAGGKIEIRKGVAHDPETRKEIV